MSLHRKINPLWIHASQVRGQINKIWTIARVSKNKAIDFLQDPVQESIEVGYCCWLLPYSHLETVCLSTHFSLMLKEHRRQEWDNLRIKLQLPPLQPGTTMTFLWSCFSSFPVVFFSYVVKRCVALFCGVEINWMLSSGSWDMGMGSTEKWNDMSRTIRKMVAMQHILVCDVVPSYFMNRNAS